MSDTSAAGGLRRRLGMFDAVMIGLGSMIGAGIFAALAPAAQAAGSALLLGLAVAAVIAVTAVNYAGVQKSAWLTRLIVAVVLAVLAAVVVTALAANGVVVTRSAVTAGSGAVLQAAGLLFFAFAGYARIATLGEEVRDPARTIPKAIPIALGVTLAVYALVAIAALTVLGPQQLADAPAPLVDTVAAAGAPWLQPVVRAGAVVAAAGSLLALLLGVSRITFAMARDRHLPAPLAAVHPRFGVPHRAELLIGTVVAVLAATADIRGAIGFSSFAVLVYYAIANTAAWTLRPDQGRPPRIVPVTGLLGCIVIAFALPLPSVVSGSAVLAVGAAGYGIRTRRVIRGCGSIPASPRRCARRRS